MAITFRDDETVQLIEKYEDSVEPMGYFMSQFQIPKNAFHNSEEVEVQIRRRGERVAVEVEDVSTGYRLNVQDKHSRLKVPPPVYKESFTMNNWKLLKRDFGNHMYQNPEFWATLWNEMMDGMREVEYKIKRRQEMQAAQVLLTGKVDLKDGKSSPTTTYSADYKPKSNHFPTAGTAWNQTGGDPLGDIMTVADRIRTDGKYDPDELHMSYKDFETLAKRQDIRDRFDNRRYDFATPLGEKNKNNGGAMQTRIQIGAYIYELWTHQDFYEEETGGAKLYLPVGNCIIKSKQSRLITSFGSIPNIGAMIDAPHQGRKLLGPMPERMMSDKAGVDMFINAWLSENGEQLTVGLGTRPLYIPIGIDTFGTIKTGVS